MTGQPHAGAHIPLPIAQLLEAARDDVRAVEGDWGDADDASALLARLTRAVTTLGTLNSALPEAPAAARPQLAIALEELRHNIRALGSEISFASGFLERCPGLQAGGYSPEGWKPAPAAHRMAVEG